jgi:hypothetical protein
LIHFADRESEISSEGFYGRNVGRIGPVPLGKLLMRKEARRCFLAGCSGFTPKNNSDLNGFIRRRLAGKRGFGRLLTMAAA